MILLVQALDIKLSYWKSHLQSHHRGQNKDSLRSNPFGYTIIYDLFPFILCHTFVWGYNLYVILVTLYALLDYLPNLIWNLKQQRFIHFSLQKICCKVSDEYLKRNCCNKNNFQFWLQIPFEVLEVTLMFLEVIGINSKNLPYNQFYWFDESSFGWYQYLIMIRGFFTNQGIDLKKSWTWSSLIIVLIWSLLCNILCIRSFPTALIVVNTFLNMTVIKIIYSEKATKFCEISTLLLTGTTYILLLHRTKVRWRFHKILWLSQNIWTLTYNLKAWAL